MATARRRANRPVIIPLTPGEWDVLRMVSLIDGRDETTLASWLVKTWLAGPGKELVRSRLEQLGSDGEGGPPQRPVLAPVS